MTITSDIYEAAEENPRLIFPTDHAFWYGHGNLRVDHISCTKAGHSSESKKHTALTGVSARI